VRFTLLRWLLPFVTAAWHIAALLRCYRRFVFDEAEGRVYGLADDVYISACFGRTLFSGHGFVWYPGAPRIEGISNPLWSVLIGALHVLPGYSPDRLGALVLALNAVLLVIASWLFWSTLERARSFATTAPAQPYAAPVAFALALLPAAIGADYWCAEGFEIALLAVLCFGMVQIALGPNLERAAIGLAIAFALGVATRMDFALSATPAVVLYALRRPGANNLGRCLGLGLVLSAALLLVRHGYYGAWLPNTYYLKATNWPLASRLTRGLAQNSALLWLVPLPLPALIWPACRRWLLREAPQSLAGWLGFALAVLYSTYVGGDAWRPFAGYDRHTAVAAMLLVWSLCGVIAALSYRPLPAALACALALPIAAWPLVHENAAARAREALFQETLGTRTFEREWIRYGKAFREISQPGARIAVCPAGAIPYFSERGGVDLLGKVDPFVARLPVSTRRPPNNACWRDAPGHNKEDDRAVFELRKPEFSRYRPPPEVAPLYAKVRYKGFQFFQRR
jgi:hypothetical protein